MKGKTVQTNKYFVLFIITLSSYMVSFMNSSISTALPIIGKEMHMDAILLSWVPTAYILSATIFLLPFGKMADLYGRKQFFSLGALIFTLFSLCCGLATSSQFLILFRVLQGIGSSLFFATNLAILITVFDLEERGKVLGINVTAVYLGISSGPLIGGFITHYFDWRIIFFSSAIIGVIILLILVFIGIKEEWKGETNKQFDWLGSLFYLVAITKIMVGITFIPDINGFILIMAGIFIFILFLILEKKIPSPLIDIQLFKKNMVFTLSNISALLNYIATAAIPFILSLYLQEIRHLNPLDAGLIIMIQPITMSIFSPITGKLSDRIEPRVLSSLGMGFISIGLLLFIFITKETSLIMIFINLILIGLGFAFFSSPNTNAVMSSIEKKFFGIASSTLATMRSMGQTLSMGIIMMLFALFIGTAKITVANQAQFLVSIKIAFIIFSFLCIFGIFTSLTRGKIRA